MIGVLYPSEKSSVRGALDLCLSLCLLCAVIAPIGGMISEAKDELGGEELLFDLPDADPSSDAAVFSAIARESGELISERLAEMIRAEFSLSGESAEVSVSVFASGEGVDIKGVTVWLRGKGVLTDPREVEAFVAKYTDAECVIVNGGRE